MKKIDSKIKEVVNTKIDIPESFETSIKQTFNLNKKASRTKKVNFRNIAVAAIVVCLVGIITPTIYAQVKWNIEYKKFENRPVKYGSALVKEAVDQGYEENIEMEYVNKDRIGVKLNSLMITNDYFHMTLDFKFEKGVQINTDTFNYGYAIYDENKNIYCVSEGDISNFGKYYRKLCKEQNIKINRKERPFLASSFGGCNILKSVDENLVGRNTMTSDIGFPRSKKLYIRIFDIGYSLTMRDENGKIIEEEYKKITDAEYDLEVEVPEKFYTRKTMELKLAQEISGLEIDKIEVTETGLTMNAKMEGFIDLLMSGKDMDTKDFNNKVNEALHLSDENGNWYTTENNSLGTLGNGKFHASFSINTNHLKDKLYLTVKIKDKSYTIQLIEK